MVFLEKRKKPLEELVEEDYRFAVEIIENVGWDAGNKKGTLVYKRTPKDGSFIVDDDGELIINSDFTSSLNRIRSSAAAGHF